MGIFDLFRKRKEQSREEGMPEPGQGKPAKNSSSAEANEEQPHQDQVNPQASKNPVQPRDRHPAPSREYYEVQQGDSLAGIARDRYGDKDKWKIIYEANKTKISDPDQIQPGLMIELPDIHSA